MTKKSSTKKINLERVGKRVLYNFIYSAMIIMLVILVSGFVSAASITNSTADVAYIYKAKLKVDQNIVSLFKEMNLTVDLIDERYMPKSFSNYKFIFVGDERFTRSIPVNDYNSIVTNYYFGEQWGLTDHDGISNLASTSPLSVRKNDQVIQVYTQAKYPTGISIPYYYLGDENKVPAMEKVAGTFTGDEYDFGDVISYAQAGTHLVNGKNAKGNICFYGIVASKYWTDEAKQMFRDCINFVGTKCSKDLDCPEDSISVKYCNNSAVYQDSRDYFCFMPGTVKSQCNNNVISSLIETCEYGCLNGACLPECTIDSDCLLNQICSNQQCVNVTCKNDSECDDSNTHTQDKCNNPGTVNSTCSNTPINCLNNLECGTNGLSGSLFCQDKDVVQNFLTFTCNNAGTVLSTCSNETTIQINKTCADACNNGACVAITCYNDSQCDDDNVKTIDQCLNPGTGASSCVHMPINCSLNSDCGTDGYLDLFCQSNNVFQNFLTFTCNNPGTANATCSSATNALLNRTCTYGCLNGACLPECTIDSDCLLNQICSNQQCVNVTCKNDSQCDDANPSTTDKCMNPGTVQSYCNNTFVKCNSNSECGTDGISGNAFCLGNSSYQNFLAYKCNNPGSGSSSCTTTTTPMLKQTCSLFCSNGDCVGCFSDENCGTDTFVGDKYCKSKDVYQDFEEFSCNSAGQVNSQCSSNTIPKLIKSCADSCYKGECKNVECTNTDDCDDNNAYTIDECNNPGTTSSYCTSTPVNCLSNNDCGITGFNGQEFCIGADVFKNYQESNCRNPGTRLSYCDISIAQQFIVGCGTGKTCSSGICMPVTCNSNSECGINRFLNQLSCSNNKIYDKFVTFTCNNPGTSISSCSSSNTDVVKQNCQYGCLGEACLPQCTQNSDCQAGQACLNNQCISIVCLGDSDCNDNNPKTADACINPGTIQSSCTHTPISCNSNAECGQNGFVDGLFCQSNNVFQNFMTYTCNNAGTIQSSCSGSVNALIKQTCTFGCSNGICNNNPCIDQDSDGYDTCSPGNPGDDGKQLDCNDNNFNVHPNAVEVCNLIDDNCNGQVDEGTNICGSNQMCVSGQCMPVVCSSNSECGTNGYLNQLFCKNGNVFDKYLTYTCNNAGTAQSSCSSSTSDLLKQTCSFGCTSGQCSNNPCVDLDSDGYDTCSPGNPGDDGKQLDCNDNNFNVHPNAVEVCNLIDDNCNGQVDEGTNICGSNQMCVQGQCQNVICNSNAQCGTDGYLNQLFCKNGNVFDKYKTYTCNNAGTAQSSCSNVNTDVLKQTCTQNQACSGGVCENLNIPCSSDSGCDDSNSHTYDKCNNPGTIQSSCSHIPIVCLNNAECGQNGFINGLFCQSNDVVQNFLTFTCNNPGTIQSSCNSQITSQINKTCSLGQSCNNGECKNVACSSNSDCGTDGYLNQLFCKNGNVFDKYKTYTCNNAGTAQSSCSNSNSEVLKQTCTQNQVCSGGVCENLNIPCSSDSGCDDANAYTYDKCNNPGTVQSSCIHTPIVCLNNLDCGQNGFINGLFCQSNDVVQNFLTFTCNNPGTIQSSCSSMVTPQLNKTCPLGQSCNNGECKNVACSSNSDCGTDGYLNQLFCKNNNSFDKYKTYTCSNPGTVQSSCSNSNSDVLKQTCSFGCTSGQCSNNPCIDQDADTYDICSPGSPGDDGKPIDCNDNNPNINPGKSEVCNLMDDNCNGQTDEGGVCVCSKDSDCGTNGFLNQLFCKNGNIFDKYKTYTCNNAGTTSNSCSDAITDKLKQTCEGSSSSVSDSGTITFNSANAPLYLPPSISDPNYKCNNDGITAWTQSNGIYPVLVSSSSSGYTSGSKLSITVPTGQICMRVATPNSNGWCKECGCRNVPNYCSDIQAPSANGLREYTDSNLKIGFYSSNVASTTNLPIAEYQLSQFVGEGMAIPAGTKYIFVYYKEEATGYFDNNVAYNMNFNFNVIESNVNPEVCNICKPIVCSKNSDCNDNNALTTDKCNNPGTTSSSCSYTPVCTSTSSQNPNYPSPYQCGGADWNIGLPRGVTCTGSVTTIGALEEDSKATQVTGNTNRLRPDLTTMNKFCQGYTGQASSYATYGRMHNYCNGCDQRLAWFENNQWTSQAVCYGVLNVQLVTCGTGCTVSPGC